MNWPDCARVTHCQLPIHANAIPVQRQTGYRRRSSASASSRLVSYLTRTLPLHELQVPALQHSAHHANHPVRASRMTSPVALRFCPLRIPSDSLFPYSCATSPAPATCQPCALTQHEARESHSHLCYRGLRAIGTALRASSRLLLRDSFMVNRQSSV